MSRWLEELIDDSIADGLCTRRYCTTCGTFDFRTRVILGAMEEAGFDVATVANVPFRDIPRSLSAEQRTAVFSQIASGLENVRSDPARSDAMEVIVIDLRPPLLKWGVGTSLTKRLGDSPAGELLAALEQQAEDDRQWAREREEFESPKAVAARKALRQEAIRRKVEDRRNEKAEKDAARARFLAELGALPRGQQLERICALETGFPLELIPKQFIPRRHEFELMDETERTQLIALIDRRRGEWGGVRGQLVSNGVDQNPDVEVIR